MLLRYKNDLWERIPTIHAFFFLASILFANLWQSFVWDEGFSRLELAAYLIIIFLGSVAVWQKLFPALPGGIRKKIGTLSNKFGLFPLLLTQLMAAYLLNALAAPSQAAGILLGNVRGKVTDILGQMSEISEGAEGMESLVNFVFAAFELLILGYILYSAMQIFSKRDDERWLDLLRTPALVLGSLLAFNFIVGLL